ncbi:hypothetical protein [Sphingomonas agri]|uniref:hypothetical protein n=1 Tax=Sphingomonas agri TaxID=1813878 RepID=UPI00311E9B2D
MTDKTRNRLTVRPHREGLIEEAEDGPLPLAILDLRLPCRRFLVDHKIAEVGKVSVTAEFLLRFVRTIGSCTEDAVQSFFGYSRREMGYVLNEVEEADYIQRLDGRLTLTSTGHGLFRPGEEEPLIFEVERKTARAGFDLISLAPAEKKYLTRFEASLPELPLTDQELVSAATERVPVSFRRFFREFAPRLDPTATARRALYSIDAVRPEDRFFTLVRVRLVSSGLRPTHVDIDLSEWRSDYDLADREAVARSIADVVENLTIARRQDDGEAYQLLVDLAPEYLKEWTRRDGLNVQRFYRHAFTSQGDIRVDRQTAPVVGSIFTEENARRLFEVASYGLRRTKRASTALFWVVPQAPKWGSTAIMSEMIDQIRDQMVRTNDDLAVRRPVQAISLSVGSPERWLREAFDRCHQSDSRVLPAGFEMLLVPGAFVAASVHAPVGQQSGIPVPLGFVSFDERVVERAAVLLASNTAPFRLGDFLEKQLAAPGNLVEEGAAEAGGDPS